jgi:hypothetical protein
LEFCSLLLFNDEYNKDNKSKVLQKQFLKLNVFN